MFQPDEPGIKLLPDALLSNYKEFQDMWEEDELIRSLEARPPSPCDVTFINDNILIDGKSSFIQRSTKRVKVSHVFFLSRFSLYRRVRMLSMKQYVGRRVIMMHLLSAYRDILNQTFKAGLHKPASRKCYRKLQGLSQLVDYRERRY